MKELKINKNYGEIFGYDKNKGKEIIYMGGISFRIINREKGIDTVRESQDTYNKIAEYISKTHISMGSAA